MLVPARKVFGILIDDIETESAAVAVEIQLEVAVLTYQFSGVKCHAEGYTEIADAQAERRLLVGFHLRLEVHALIHTFGLNLRS